MRTIREVSLLTGVSKRTLQYYDQIHLLPPSKVTEAGYRLYDDRALERLQQILMYRELQFPLQEIRRILDSTDYDRNRALEQQIEMLEMKKTHLENLIVFAKGMRGIGMKNLDFSAFDTRKLDEYVQRAKDTWGHTPEYREFEHRSKGRSKADEQLLGDEMMQFFKRLGSLRTGAPDAPEAQEIAAGLQQFITQHFYACSDQIFLQLGQMYGGGGSFTENIDAVGGEGTGAFACEVIRHYCEMKKA